ncbi:hypothetical protein HY408_00310 [Candidatus Gottesmanbacteria bacterium]|nr:hypothetical protein [Candidatus Gottesmanbacteria bacterium]
MFFFLLAFLPIALSLLKTTQKYLTRAKDIPADIVIDASTQLGVFVPHWTSLSQGGEGKENLLLLVQEPLKNIHPRYIRIDHIYDLYDVVSRDTNGTLVYDFSRLDGIVDAIIDTEALPFFSLSYMPPPLAQDELITSPPKRWSEWQEVVKTTIEYYSGQKQRNLSNVYYEVWNEPDLFGSWKYSTYPNYLTLYDYAVQGAAQTDETNPYKIGGPALTRFYENWIAALLDKAAKDSLRLDFLSWHTYSTNPQEFVENASKATEILSRYPKFRAIPLLVTEWGFDSTNHPGYDDNRAAAFTVATIKQTINVYDQMFAFEIVDGRDPAGNEYWGRWGLITHPDFGAHLKPRYYAFTLLSQLSGKLLHIEGEGSFVSAIATHDRGSVKILLSNYDMRNAHTEDVPLKIYRLSNGNYLKQVTRLGSITTEETVTIAGNEYTNRIIMPPNSVVLIELIPQP